MKLQENEQVVKVFHHHATTRLFRAAGILIAGFPFYFVAWFLRDVFTTGQMFSVYFWVGAVHLLVLLYDSIFYYLDRLVITNRRVLYIDWNGVLNNTEHEAELMDIQDIKTRENGLFAFLPIFDFGDFTLETASTRTTIKFPNAPDPEGIKDFIYHLNIKPNRMHGVGLRTMDDTKRETTQDAPAVTRRQ